MVKRWFLRLTIVGALSSGASCLISVKDYPLERGNAVGGGGDSGSSGDGPLAGEAGEESAGDSEGGAVSDTLGESGQGGSVVTGLGGAAGASTLGGWTSSGGSSAGAAVGGAPDSAGSTSGWTGCAAPAWVSGTSYKSGDVLTAICRVPGGGATACVTGKKYPWTCSGPSCAVYAPGGDGWWANWTIGTVCS